jgi:hypothetical protein
MDDDLEPRLPPHEYCKGSYRDYIEAREGGVSKVASEEVTKKKTRHTRARNPRRTANTMDPSTSGRLGRYVLPSTTDPSAQ